MQIISCVYMHLHTKRGREREGEKCYSRVTSLTKQLLFYKFHEMYVCMFFLCVLLLCSYWICVNTLEY